MVLLWLLVAAQASVAGHEVQSVGLTVGDLDRELRFFTQVLPFQEVSRSVSDAEGSAKLLGLPGVKLKIAVLKLGEERITLTEHVGKGQPIPFDSRSYDRWFQHIAIVVRDMDQAYAHLRQHKVKYVSSAPQTLPASNKAAAGIKAFYFRDPEDHVLEIIWFPNGKGDPKWQQLSHASGSLSPSDGERAGVRGFSSPDTRHPPLFLGIDHTAIVISDTDASLAFYRDLLGMRVVGESENYGVEQEHLNQVFGAHLRITALRAERGPGIEFLEYLSPPGGRPLPEGSKPNDLVFWHTDLRVDSLNALTRKLTERGTKVVSGHVADPSGANDGIHRALMVRDPDGHALEFFEATGGTISAAKQ